MAKYYIRKLTPNDYREVANIYNSNQQFLLNHLGCNCIDETFIAEEVLAMSDIGFISCAIVNRENQAVQGVIEYKAGKETYLSLLMLAADIQGHGVGRDIYVYFESEILQAQSDSIRIDVVNDYQHNALPFWRKLDFLECETVTLNWGNKKSSAVVMRKNIQR